MTADTLETDIVVIDQDADPIEEETQQAAMPSLSTPEDMKQLHVQEQKKKKKKKKSKKLNLPEAGTELADDYQEKYPADPVSNPFDPEKLLVERVEYALWKYRKNHRFSENNTLIFASYLKFGCVQTGPNAFVGRTTGSDGNGDPNDEEDFEAAKQGTDVLPDYADEDLEVNFTEVVQVFLGNFFVRNTGFVLMENYVNAPCLIDAFLRYLEMRHVCPEYSDDIRQARTIANLAKTELPMCKQLSNLLPGEFNKACSILFDGDAEAVMPVDMAWASPDILSKMGNYLAEVIGMSSEDALRIVKSVVGPIDGVHVSERRHEVTVKVTHLGEENHSFVPVTLVDYKQEDTQFVILLEPAIVVTMRVGMVMDATLHKLSSGQWYLHHASLICPSFFKEDVPPDVIWCDTNLP